MFKLKELPYEKNDLEPYISSKTIDFHYGAHHKAYVNKLNELISDKDELRNLSLKEIIKKTYNNEAYTAIFNNAAQVYNHDFFWHSLKKSNLEMPISENLKAKIEESFSSLENFKKIFSEFALAQFGSGWVWLVENKDKKLEIIKTANADNPLTLELKPLFTIDVWEHAYYLDYQNKRADFIKELLDNLINWDFVNNNLNE